MYEHRTVIYVRYLFVLKKTLVGFFRSVLVPYPLLLQAWRCFVVFVHVCLFLGGGTLLCYILFDSCVYVFFFSFFLGGGGSLVSGELLTFSCGSLSQRHFRHSRLSMMVHNYGTSVSFASNSSQYWSGSHSLVAVRTARAWVTQKLVPRVHFFATGASPFGLLHSLTMWTSREQQSGYSSHLVWPQQVTISVC